MRVSWNHGHTLVALLATTLVLQGTSKVQAQFAPLSNQTPAYTQTQTPLYNQTQTPVFAQNQTPIYAQNQVSPQQQMLPQYTAMAYQADGGHVAAPVQTAAPVQDTGCAPQASAPCNNYQAAPATNYASGCATGNCGYGGVGYNTFQCDYGCGSGRVGYGLGLGARQAGCNRWFGGFYGLYMGREGNDWVPLAFSGPAAAAPGYYPTDTEYVMNKTSLDHDFQGGAEVRLGRFIGGHCCDPCGCCGPRFALEGVYWGLTEDEQTATVTDLSTDANRLYSMIDFRGLEADMGPGARPLNHYFDYAPPSADYTNGGALDEIQVRTLTARSTFSAQNLELNLLRIPVAGGRCASSCGAGCASSGGCDSCGTRGCCGGSCGCAPRYTLTTLAGVRYFRVDDDLYFRSDWENMATTATGFAAYNASVDNHLVGFQLGCNGTYNIGCAGRWALHCSANTGIYGNHMEVEQWVDVPPGGSVDHISGGSFRVDTTNDDVAFIGELRVGGSYQYSCNWRFYGGYRAMGVSGLALAFDQIPTAFSTPSSVSYVSSTGSIFLHGLQAGVECTY